MISSLCNSVFEQAVQDYHVNNNVDAINVNPFKDGSIEFLLYGKNWIDTVQWHLEDIIRNPVIDPYEALLLKRRIDSSNQVRTDMVEYIDGYFLDKYQCIKPTETASINTESPAWAIDRLSILMLKIYHMREESHRHDASEKHKEACHQKLQILLQQQSDLSKAIDDLIIEIEGGRKYMKVYKQMKMYNDPSLNPVLYTANK